MARGESLWWRRYGGGGAGRKGMRKRGVAEEEEQNLPARSVQLTGLAQAGSGQHGLTLTWKHKQSTARGRRAAPSALAWACPGASPSWWWT